MKIAWCLHLLCSIHFLIFLQMFYFSTDSMWRENSQLAKKQITFFSCKHSTLSNTFLKFMLRWWKGNNYLWGWVHPCHACLVLLKIWFNYNNIYNYYKKVVFCNWSDANPTKKWYRISHNYKAPQNKCGIFSK